MLLEQASPFSETDPGIIAAAARFAESYVLPHAARWEQERVQPAAILREAIGVFSGTTIPVSQGGCGHNFATAVRVYEEFARRDLAFACALAVHSVVTVALARSPNEQLSREVLPELLSGRSLAAFLLTEPGAGSDATAIVCAANKVDNGYQVTGAKSWVTNGVNADVLLTFCQTSPGAGAKGMLAVLARRNCPSVAVSGALSLFGSHAMGTTDVVFDDCPVGDADVAFPVGSGFQAAMGGLNIARLGVAALCNGALQGGLESAVRYATTRQAFGKSIYTFQGIQMPLAEVATDLEASRSLTFQAAALLDAGKDCTVLAAHAKKFATRAAFQGLSVCMQALGANGLKDEFGIGRQLAAARVAEFMDGTTEIQNIVIGRALAKRLTSA